VPRSARWLLFLLGACYVARARPAAPEAEPPRLETRRVHHDGSAVERVVYHVLVYADGRRERHGPELRRHPGGSVEFEGAWDHGRPAGVWHTWYEDGTPRSEVDFGDGEYPSPMRFWHPNGALWGAGDGIAGVRVGPWTYWRSDGSIEEQGCFDDGLRAGIWASFDASGEPRDEARYEHGRRVGEGRP
jgi:antitoxin component YwqK of YwqJK toxin-antitoxin module